MLMKRMLLFAVLAGIAAGTAGCKQQDAPKLDRQAVRLYVGDQVRITVDKHWFMCVYPMHGTGND